MDDAAGQPAQISHPGCPYMSGTPFGRFTHADVRDLIAGAPLAWLWPRAGQAHSGAPGQAHSGAAGQAHSGAADDPHAGAMLPLMGEYDADGALVALVGHLSRGNPLLTALGADGAVGVHVTGPQGYVSPAHVGRTDWAPTWMWAHITVTGQLTLDPAATVPLVDRLVTQMEAGRAQPWSAAAIAHRAAPMLARIVGFRIAVAHVSGWFKLGQDEDAETLRALLDSSADPAMLQWVRRFNGDRLG